MDYLLHIDTSTDIGTVAIGRDGVLAAQRINTESRNHASALNIMINDVLAEAKIDMQQLSGIVVCSGPGSYTGLRIGMATAKGLCYVLDKPLLLNDRLTLLAYQKYKAINKYDYYISLITAREKEYFITIYNKDFVCEVPPQHIFETQLSELLRDKENQYIITDLPELPDYCPKVNIVTLDNNINIDVNDWISHAHQNFLCNNIVNLSQAEPLYLKQVYTHK